VRMVPMLLWCPRGASMPTGRVVASLGARGAATARFGRTICYYLLAGAASRFDADARVA